MEGRGAPVMRLDAAAALVTRKALKESGARSGESLVAEIDSEVFDYLQELQGEDGSVLQSLETSGIKFVSVEGLDRDDVHFASNE